MRKYFIFFILFSAVVFFGSRFSYAAKPSDFGLKEGDLISAIFSDDPDVYIINEHGYKRLFLNPEIFKFYAHLGGFTNVKLVTSEVRDSFPTVGLFRNCEKNNPKVYGFEADDEDSGKLRWIDTSGEQAVEDDPDFFKKVFCINEKEFKWYPKGEELKTVKEIPQYHRATPAVPAIPAIPASPSQPLVSPTATPTLASGSFTPTPTPTPTSISVTQPAIPATPATPAQPTTSSSTPTPTPTLTASPTPTVTASPSFSPTPTPVPGSQPNSPTNLSAKARSSSQIDLNWSASSNAIETGVVRYDVFKLFYRADGGQVGRSYITNVSASPYSSTYSYSDTNLIAGITYTYWVTAVAAYWNSDLSISASATPTSTPTPTPTPTSSVSFDNFSRNLAGAVKITITRDLFRGTSGNDVKQLQAFLVNEVGFPSDLLTGYFGSITRDAVKRLQAKYGVKPTSGYFGEITRKALRAFISN